MAGHGSRLTDAEHERIGVLFRSVLAAGTRPTATAIAREIGRSRGAVQASLETAGLVKPGPRRLTDAERRRIAALYWTRRNGRWLSCEQVGKIVGRGAVTVLAVLRAAGISRSRSEALTLHVPEDQSRLVIRVYEATRWGLERVAAALKIKPSVVRKILEQSNTLVPRGPNSHAKVRVREAQLLRELYRQGQSAPEIAQRTGRHEGLIRNLVRDAGLLRSPSEGNRLARLRSIDRTWLARTDIRPWAERWLAGAEVEDLASELGVAGDLLWDHLAAELAEMQPHPRQARDDERCVDCPFACAAFCPRRGTTIIVRETRQAPPRTSARAAVPRDRVVVDDSTKAEVTA